ncbi:hypothetical protein ABTC66_20155, partial [Acinetobacter baumannii]
NLYRACRQALLRCREHHRANGGALCGGMRHSTWRPLDEGRYGELHGAICTSRAGSRLCRMLPKQRPRGNTRTLQANNSVGAGKRSSAY